MNESSQEQSSATHSELTVGPLHHLALGARDVSRLAAFYQAALGLKHVITHLEDDGQVRSIWLSLDQSPPTRTVLMIERVVVADPSAQLARPAQPSAASGVVPGLFLLAFTIPVADRPRFEEQLVRAGAELLERGTQTSYARDPEGNRLAVSCYPLHEL